MESTPITTKINWKYQFQQYGTALVLTIPLFIALSVYLFYRRGTYDLFIINKVSADVTTILLGIVLLLGPLSRLFSFPDRYVEYRKELGIVAFFLAFFHAVTSFFFLPSRFPISGFLGTLNFPFIFGLIATVALIAIFFISNSYMMNILGRERWWRLQYWGIRLTFLFTLLHVFVMKWGGWVKWYGAGGSSNLAHPGWPDAGLLIGWFIIFVVALRLAELINPKFGRIVCYASVIILPAVYLTTFWWGNQLIN